MTQTLPDIADALAQTFDSELRRQFNRQSVLVGLIANKPNGGKNCAWDVTFSAGTAGTYAEIADVAPTDINSDVDVPAVLNWGRYRGNFGLSGVAQSAAAGAQGSAVELLNQLEKNLRDKASALIAEINRDLFSGAGGDGLVGLDSALANTGVYAQIDRATYPEWQANVNENAGSARALDKALLDAMETSIFNACGQPPDVIVCSPGVANRYESLFAPMTRVVLDGAARKDVSPAARSSVAGDTGLDYKGIRIYRDRHCPGGTLYMLNTDRMQVRSLPQVGPGSRIGLDDENGEGGGIAARIRPLAVTGDADKYSLQTYLQLQVDRPSAHGVIRDIEE